MKKYIFLGAFVGGLLSALILILLYASFKLGVGWYFLSADEKSVGLLADVILPLASTFFGAAAGSYFSYKLQLVTKKEDEVEKEVYMIRKAFLAIEAQLNDLATIKKSVIYPYRNRPLRFIEMPVTVGYSGIIASLDQDIAVPLARLKEAEALNRARFAERYYLNCVAIQNAYEEEIIRYTDKLLAGGVNHLDISSLTKKTRIAGGGTIAQLYSIGEEFIRAVDDAVVDLREVLEIFSSLYNRHYSALKGPGLKIDVAEDSDFIFEKSPPPKISSLAELLELAKYTPKYHDPKSDDSYPVVKLGTRTWKPASYF